MGKKKGLGSNSMGRRGGGTGPGAHAGRGWRAGSLGRRGGGAGTRKPEGLTPPNTALKRTAPSVGSGGRRRAVPLGVAAYRCPFGAKGTLDRDGTYTHHHQAQRASTKTLGQLSFYDAYSACMVLRLMDTNGQSPMTVEGKGG